MGEVKRYNPDPYCRCNTWNEADDGCIVAASDYDALKTERDLLLKVHAAATAVPMRVGDAAMAAYAYDEWKRSRGVDDE